MAARRMVDLLVACAALPLALPVMAVIAATLSVTDGGPVLFRQVRVTRGKRRFELIKFRTMSDARDAQGRLLPDGMRMTRLGRFLRRSRLDELPQLWNILTGSMSLIGPRPLLPQSIEAAGEAGWRRCEVSPGLTGWAQVNGNALLDEQDKFALDLWYIANRSLRLDLTILVRTVGVALLGERFNPSSIRRAHEGHSGWRS